MKNAIVKQKGEQYDRFIAFMTQHMSRVPVRFRRWLANKIWNDGDIGRWEGTAYAQLFDVDGTLLMESSGHNIGTNEGMQNLLNSGLTGGVQITAWYMGPYSGVTTPLATWSASNFNSNATEIAAYDETTRRQNVFASVVNNAFTGTNIIITANAGFTIRGIGLLSSPTKQDTSGTLLAAANITAVPVTAAQTVNLRYDGSIALS